MQLVRLEHRLLGLSLGLVLTTEFQRLNTMSDTIDVNEIFGPTLQGEGSAAGQHCLFVRLAYCNLECKWCDTAYTWAFTPDKASRTVSNIQYDKEANIHPMAASDIVSELEKLYPIMDRPTNIIISGGEPLMQSRQLEPLVQALDKLDCMVHIETAGTLKPTEYLHQYVTQYNVSPKLSHSGNRTSKRFKPQVLQWFASQSKSWFKFVVQEIGDLIEVDHIVQECNISIDRVMIMPEGIKPSDNLVVARRVAREAINRGYGISFRTHILLWPEVDRGR